MYSKHTLIVRGLRENLWFSLFFTKKLKHKQLTTYCNKFYKKQQAFAYNYIFI